MINILYVYALFFAFFCSTVSSAPTSRATPSDIEALITELTSESNAASSMLGAFPSTGGSLLQALAIHTALSNLNQGFQSGTTDVLSLPMPISDADATAIINQVNSQLTPALGSLFAGIMKFPNDSTLGGVPALVKQDGATLSASVQGFYNVLGIATPVMPGS
ncbi:hypothetical protein P691DRAFT_680784 [Macrolepiota fuliginosa MF-IS2]|uniref:Uncharacterized protein n=1 Tax=Macrolepiota fuliginosa MF-IS2 TaxID=1400762 RepID=A0A9P5X3Z6_9AGAR|nr:hypothetical protein P691DRAFT_680784 [Macrolepiota fuliginosa MF-IS2]